MQGHGTFSELLAALSRLDTSGDGRYYWHIRPYEPGRSLHQNNLFWDLVHELAINIPDWVQQCGSIKQAAENLKRLALQMCVDSGAIQLAERRDPFGNVWHELPSTSSLNRYEFGKLIDTVYTLEAKLVADGILSKAVLFVTFDNH